jgi:CheY-like chemotaxis protein
MRVLVVDERFDSRWVISGWLSELRARFFVDSAASGDEALAAIERVRPDFVLADHNLPDMDGCELARRVKAAPNPPVVIIMAQTKDAKLDAECAAAGVDTWLEKRHLQARLPAFLAAAEGATVRRRTAE